MKGITCYTDGAVWWDLHARNRPTEISRKCLHVGSTQSVLVSLILLVFNTLKILWIKPRIKTVKFRVVGRVSTRYTCTDLCYLELMVFPQ